MDFHETSRAYAIHSELFDFCFRPKTRNLKPEKFSPCIPKLHGKLHVNEYPIYQQVEARKNHENGNIYNYKQFQRSSVMHFTDALFGVMPKKGFHIDVHN